MNRTYDLFEVFPDGSLLWQATVVGHEEAIAQLQVLGKKTKNEVRAMHLPTKAVVAAVNAREPDGSSVRV
jgi:hypothetical protein